MSSYDPFNDPRRQVIQLRNAWKQWRRYLVPGFVAFILVVGGFQSYYQVEPEEVGVILRFGKYQGKTDPGLHFKIPFGVDELIKVPVRRQLKREFGFRTARADVRSEYIRDRRTKGEAKMVTGDLNVSTVEWIVQFIIQDPYKYLFKFRNLAECEDGHRGCRPTLRLMTEAAMRKVVGDYSLNELLTSGREEIEREALAKFNELNKLYDTGIVIQQLKLQDVNVPDIVKPALREVEEAKQERERLVNVAEQDYNKVIPRARGRALEQIEAAEGYRVARINEAEGDAGRFRALYAEYRKAPTVTRTRLYLEAIDEILPKTKRKIIVDSETKGLLPLLNLNGGQ